MDEKQQKSLQLQIYAQQLRQIQQQIQQLEQQGLELDAIKQALSDMQKVEVGSEVLVPMSSGIFVRAKLSDNKRVIVNVGAGVACEKTFDEASALIAEQQDELKKVQAELVKELEKMALATQMLEKELS